MSGRALAWSAVTICAVLLACSGLISLLFGGGAAACSPPAAGGAASSPATPAGGFEPVGQWNSQQVANAAAIIAVGARRGVPPRGWVIAVATAMQESTLRNLAGGDRDSVGLFQQRPSQGWGTPAQLRDPAYAAGKFFDRLLAVDGWQQMPVTDAAQAVQRSAYPDAYAKWEDDAAALVQTVSGVAAGDLAACAVTISAQGWTQPVRAGVVSGFRTAQRPSHQGVDLGAARGTPIHAAADGVVTVVACNITPASWGCDRDGNPSTPGCGWYSDITHAQGVKTRYCHLGRRPAVAVGQRVTAGQVIGVVGSSGHSSGPHLHFEVLVDDVPLDPVIFMRQVGAPLGLTE